MFPAQFQPGPVFASFVEGILTAVAIVGPVVVMVLAVKCAAAVWFPPLPRRRPRRYRVTRRRPRRRSGAVRDRDIRDEVIWWVDLIDWVREVLPDRDPP